MVYKDVININILLFLNHNDNNNNKQDDDRWTGHELHCDWFIGNRISLRRPTYDRK